MRRINLVLAFLLLILISSQCQLQETGNRVYSEADSILTLTLALQSRIGSPEIKRMNDFQAEINADMTELVNLENKDTTLVRYRDLFNGLGQCMQACNQFHEEGYILESSLREIMAESLEKRANMKKLEEMLIYETENYRDLFQRTDSSLKLVMRQAEIYYNLKPEIDRIKEQEKTK